jgi:ribosome modulation factor
MGKMPPVKKFVTDEYHEGQVAYINGRALTTNPYLKREERSGAMWYWIFGWQDAMADDVRDVKRTIMTMVQPIDTGNMN